MDFDGPGFGWGYGFLHIGSFLIGLVIAAAIIAVTVLLVRYLVVATRAAQFYLDQHAPTAQQRPQPPHDGTTATPAAASTPTAASTPASATTRSLTKPMADPTPPDVPRTTRTRTPKTPPAGS